MHIYYVHMSYKHLELSTYYPAYLYHSDSRALTLP
jgi:hypothetical protein